MGGVVKSITKAVGGVLGGESPKAPPPLPEPEEIPLPDADAARLARERELRRRRGSSGRTSTILSDEDAGLGG